MKMIYLIKKNNYKTIIFYLAFTLSTFLNAQTQKGENIIRGKADGYFGFSVSMPDSNTLAVGSPRELASKIGLVQVFEWIGDSWIQKGSNIFGASALEELGSSVSMPDPNTIAIGAIRNQNAGANSGTVRVYKWSNGDWEQKGVSINGLSAGDLSGASISMPDSNTLAIGAANNDVAANNSGQVRVFQWNGNAWVQKGLDVYGESEGDFFGSSISMSDSNTIAIGAKQINPLGNGYTSIYKWVDGSWVQKGANIIGQFKGDYSGISVVMPNNQTVAVGASLNDGSGKNAGNVRVFLWDGISWNQKGMDIQGEMSDDEFGISISMPDENTIAVGSKGLNEAGSVSIYKWNGFSWIKLSSSILGENSGDNLGVSISMPDTKTLAIGAHLNDLGGNNAGYVRVFEILSVLGIVENEFKESLLIYPNPSNGNLYLDLGENYSFVQVNVKNQIGQTISEYHYNSSNKININIEGSAGIYFLEVISNNEKAIVKVLKN